MGLSEIREKFSENRKLGFGIVAGMMILAIALIVRWYLAGPEIPQGVAKWYFYNVKTNERYVVDAGTEAPSDTKDGPKTGVRAMVFSCGDCSDESKRITVYLQSKVLFKSSMVRRPSPALKPGVTMVKVIRRPADKEWVMAGSKVGLKILSQVQERCADQRPIACNPPSSSR